MTARFVTLSGWADDRLMQAYDLIWEVERDNKALGVEPEAKAILAAIEALSDLMIQERRSAA